MNHSLEISDKKMGDSKEHKAEEITWAEISSRSREMHPSGAERHNRLKAWSDIFALDINQIEEISLGHRIVRK